MHWVTGFISHYMKSAPAETQALTAAGSDLAAGWAGPQLWTTLGLLAIPAGLAALVALLGLELPVAVLYGVASVFGLILLYRLRFESETLLALAVCYLPLSKSYVAPISPGVNATNILEVLLLLAWLLEGARGARTQAAPRTDARLVALWAALSSLSMVTETLRVGGDEFFSVHAESAKAWLDQFVVFFAFLNLIRDGKMARRVAVYAMLSSVFVLALGFVEWLDKRDIDKIDHARLLGPQLQPNDLGGYLAYSAGPFLGLLFCNWTRVRSWWLAPYFLLLVRVVVATFSRGAYIGLGVAVVCAAFVRGRLFFFASSLALVLMVFQFPSLVPESLRERMEQTTSTGIQQDSLDRSSETRLLLWNAAIDMTLENPILGKGFGSFAALKGAYTEINVEEADNHNMFLYICSQMGIPALIAFALVILRMLQLGARLFRRCTDNFGRSLGLGGAAMAAAVIGVNMFGSRMVDICVSAEFWVYLAVLAVMWQEVRARSSERAK